MSSFNGEVAQGILRENWGSALGLSATHLHLQFPGGLFSADILADG